MAKRSNYLGSCTIELRQLELSRVREFVASGSDLVLLTVGLWPGLKFWLVGLLVCAWKLGVS